MEPLIQILKKLAEQPIEEQYHIIERCYCWLSVFSNSLPVSKRKQAKLEFSRIVNLTKLTGVSLGEQVAIELQNPNEFLSEYYVEFLKSACFLAGMVESEIEFDLQKRASKVAQNEWSYLVFRELNQVD